MAVAVTKRCIFAFVCFALVGMITAMSTPPIPISTTPAEEPSTQEDTTTTTTVPPTTAAVEPSTTTEEETTTEAETTTTTTTIPPPPYSCYECDSGSTLPGMWHNAHCNENGMMGFNAYVGSCSTLCYSYVGRYPAGTVYRGCASNLWFGDRPIVDGCYEDTQNNRFMCLCSGHHCNVQNLTTVSQNYVARALAGLP